MQTESDDRFPRDVVEALDQAVGVFSSGYDFVDSTTTIKMSFDTLHQASVAAGGRLLDLGLRLGDRVALILPEGRDFIPAFLGALYAGLVPVPLYPPLAFNDLEGYLLRTQRLLELCSPSAILTVDWLRDVVKPLNDRVAPVVVLDTSKSTRLDVRRERPRADDLAFLQFTSGSTGTPKAVEVTHGALRANAAAIIEGCLGAKRGRDRGVSWLPLYHDMGLMGFVIAPLFRLLPVSFISTMSFLKDPTLWLQTIHEERATVTFAPNFAYGLVVKRLEPERLKEWDLSCVRVFGCGAEPIQATTLRKFAESLAPAGVRSEALLACYGMAEATLAVSFGVPGNSLKTLSLEADALHERGEAVPARSLETPAIDIVSCGRVIDGHEARVVDPHGKALPDRSVGQLLFRGPSVARGYWGNEVETERSFRGGWLHTGDLAFLDEGDIYITGREKDVIVLHGKNYDPHIFEWAAAEVPGVRRGNVAAVPRPGQDTEELVLVCECELPSETLVADVRRAVVRATQVNPAEIVIVAPGTLPKTSSGKLQRRRTKQLYLSRSFNMLR